MDRPPKPAPFTIGTPLIFRTDVRVYASEDPTTLLRWPGQEYVVIEARPGHQGTLRDVSDAHDDEPVYDTTTDGTNVAEAANGQRLLVRWEAVEDGRWVVVPNEPSCGGDPRGRCAVHRGGSHGLTSSEACRHV